MQRPRISNDIWPFHIGNVTRFPPRNCALAYAYSFCNICLREPELKTTFTQIKVGSHKITSCTEYITQVAKMQ